MSDQFSDTTYYFVDFLGCYDAPMNADLDKINLEIMVEWQTYLQGVRQRGTLVITGEADWCHSMATKMLVALDLASVCWVSNTEKQGLEIVTARQARTLLGQERDAIVFDAHAGFDADAFGAVSGTIVGGGLMLLLCPPLAQWAQFADPAAERIAVWPHSFADVSGRFLQRIGKIISESPAVKVIEQNAALPVSPELFEIQNINIITRGSSFVENACAEDGCCTEDQRTAVAAIEQVANGPTQCPLVLVADRGRGKTAALGIAAARLLRTKPQMQAMNIVVTAPRPAAVQPLFEQAKKLLSDASVNNNSLQWNESNIQFVAPDALCLSNVSADLLLVDEAAAIPASLLQQFLTRYPRIVFSTTTHGYEGTGRGFAVRFRQTLNKLTPGWKEVRLQEPIRWAVNDPLERLVFDALLLDAACADNDSVAMATVGNVSIEKVSRDDLSDNESLLSQIFGLLVVAHYRTRPNDLRNLLDGPGLSVYVCRYQGQVVATALMAAEGGFDAQTADAIYAGSRRPRGHLLPQSLTTHAGLKAAAGLLCARVMRIAVHPAVQRKGLGAQLLRHIKEDATKQGADLLGSSFGATAHLLHFWQQENVWPVRLGFRRGHASGEYSVLMLAGLSAAGEEVYAAARTRFKRDLPQWLADPLRGLDVAVSSVLLEHAGEDIQGDTEMGLPKMHDQEMLTSFVNGERTYEDALAPIWRLLSNVDKQQAAAAAASIDYNVLKDKALQKQSWGEVAGQFGLVGKAEVLVYLRRAVSQLLD